MVRSRAGFTLIEVAIAVAMLGIVMLGLLSTTSRMLHTVTDDRSRTIAAKAADEKLALTRQWPVYSTLDSAYAGVEADTPQAGWTRTTTIARIGGLNQPDDYKRITVTVDGPGLPAPVSRSISVAAP